jgi:hypothetical protein
VAERIILIYNAALRRFAVKLRATGGGDIASAGTGGLDETTGQWYPGRFVVRTLPPAGTAHAFCLLNDGFGTVDDTGAACADLEAQGVVTGTGADWTAAVASFLELDATDQSQLAGFVSLLGSSDPIPTANYPASASDLPTAPAARE